MTHPDVSCNATGIGLEFSEDRCGFLFCHDILCPPIEDAVYGLTGFMTPKIWCNLGNTVLQFVVE